MGCLLSVVCCLLSVVCCLLSVVCCLFTRFFHVFLCLFQVYFFAMSTYRSHSSGPIFLLCLLSQGGSFCSPAPYLLLLPSYPCPVLIDPLLRVPCDHQVIIYYSVLILTHFTSTLVNMAVIASNLVKHSLSLLPQLGHDFLS